MAAGRTYEPIATTTLGTAASSITFNSISGSYTDLKIVAIGAPNTSGIWWGFRLNSDTGTNYSYTLLQGDISSASTARTINSTFGLANYNNITGISHAVFEFFSYANTSINKSVLTTYCGDNDGAGTVQKSINLWRSTSAITSIEIWMTNTDKFGVGTTVTLYGITKA